MENNQAMCYITYAVPRSFLPPLGVDIPIQESFPAEDTTRLYPPGFMPEWVLGGGFPEDDFDD